MFFSFPENIPLNEMQCNGDARHEGDRDREHEERGEH